MIVTWSAEALIAFDKILSFVEESSPKAAVRLERQLIESIDRLALFPEAGRQSFEQPGYRELVVAPYIVRYMLVDDSVLIASIRHGARDRETTDPEEAHEPEMIYGSGATLLA